MRIQLLSRVSTDAPIQRSLFHQHFCYIEILLLSEEIEITRYLSRQSMLTEGFLKYIVR